MMIQEEPNKEDSARSHARLGFAGLVIPDCGNVHGGMDMGIAGGCIGPAISLQTR